MISRGAGPVLDGAANGLAEHTTVVSRPTASAERTTVAGRPAAEGTLVGGTPVRADVPSWSVRVSQNGDSLLVPLMRAETLVGRSPSADIAIQDPLASGRHARIRYTTGEWWIEDLGSTNGTRLNDEPLLPDRPRKLRPGDRVAVGNATLTFS